MTHPVISSAANPLAKRVRLLTSDRRARRRERSFVVEGVAPVWRAVDASADVELLLVSAEQLDGDAAVARLVAAARSKDLAIQPVSPELFARLAARDAPAGVMAILRGIVGSLDGLAVGDEAVVLALHEVSNPGNLGTIIRTADSAGIAAVVTIGTATDPLSPAAVKASMGAIFDVPVAHADTLEDFFSWAQSGGLRVVTTSARAPSAFGETDWSPPLALLLGSEGEGLPREALDRGDAAVRIPMVGASTSLNLSVAAGILAFEARRAALDRVIQRDQ